MAFPTFINAASTTGSTNPLALTMPASIVAGRLLVLHTMSSFVLAALTASGWTSIQAYNGGSFRLYTWGKIAAGSDTLSIGNTGPSNVAAIIAQYDTWSGVLADIKVGTGTASLDPPSLTPAGGAKDYLWVPVVAAGAAAAVASAAPTNYSNLQSVRNTGASWSLSMATRALNATSEDPGVFTGGGTTGPASTTISIAPSLDTALPRPLRVMSQAVTRASTY